ncbi:hypothetical protein JCGZ_19225 [Jatropha curcas]|uniref:Uncharacterized protein n=1 Tax=Jatropha curcas TaxID=180498 RepID=A0A067K052_JATCU|nr:hypothetical protein JCGZ_19225 [Jatropha curcas]
MLWRVLLIREIVRLHSSNCIKNQGFRVTLYVDHDARSSHLSCSRVHFQNVARDGYTGSVDNSSVPQGHPVQENLENDEVVLPRVKKQARVESLQEWTLNNEVTP